MLQNKQGFSHYFRLFLLAVAIITVYKTYDNFARIKGFIDVVLGILNPFFIGFVIAYVLNPMVERLQEVFVKAKVKWLDKKAKGMSIAFVYVVLTAFLVLMGSYLKPLANNVGDLINKLPSYLTLTQKLLRDFISQSTLFASVDVDSLFRPFSADNLIQQLRLDNMWNYLEGVWSATSILMNIFFGLIISAYLLIEKEALMRQIKTVLKITFKPKVAALIRHYIKITDEIFMRFFVGKLVTSVIVGVLMYIGFLSMGVEYALLFSVILAVTNMIPYFGPFIGGIPIVLIVFLGDPMRAVWVAAYITLVQQLDAIVIGPKIIGDSVGISPFWAIFAIFLGGGLFGFPGMVVSIPVLGALRVLINDLIEKREKQIAFKRQKEGTQ